MRSINEDDQGSPDNYREMAATLRQLAGRLHGRHQAREKLLALADQFDEFASTGEGQVQ